MLVMFFFLLKLSAILAKKTFSLSLLDKNVTVFPFIFTSNCFREKTTINLRKVIR